MKKFFLFLAAVMMAVGANAQLKIPSATINGDLQGYKYVYVVSTTGMTSSSGVSGGLYGNSFGVSGGSTKTISPSEYISGFFMKRGMNVMPAVDPELAAKTMIVSFGHTGRRELSLGAYASGIILQVSNAKTHEVIATFEAEGCGRDETEDIEQALDKALRLYTYYLHPEVAASIERMGKGFVALKLTNKTPQNVKHLTIRLTYYLNGELVYEQVSPMNISIPSGYYVDRTVYRDKPARSNKQEVRVEIIDYN